MMIFVSYSVFTMCLLHGRHFYKLGIYKFTGWWIKNVVQHKEEGIIATELPITNYKSKGCVQLQWSFEMLKNKKGENY